MSRRIFIGIPATEEIQSKVAEWEQGFLISESVKGLKIRWIKSQNLHITLMPPWEISHKVWNMEHEALKKSLQLAADETKAFEISFKEISFGPNPREPRMIWARGQAPNDLIVLKEEVEKNISSITHGREQNKNLLKLHMTLARLSSFVRPFSHQFETQRGRVLPGARRQWEINWAMMADRFVLYESHLSSAGADYEVLEEFQLNP